MSERTCPSVRRDAPQMLPSPVSPSCPPLSLSLPSTHSWSSLPPELLHRIFRFLSPSSLYATIPRVSRHFRVLALDAVPGCRGGLVGVDCEVAFSTEGATGGCVLAVEDRFRTTQAGGWAGTGTGLPLWAAASAYVPLRPETLLLGGCDALDTHVLQTLAFECPSVFKLHRAGRLRLCVSKLGVSLSGRQHRPEDLAVLRTLATYAHTHAVPDMHIELLEGTLPLTLLPPTISFSSVTRLEVDVLAPILDSAVEAENLVVLLERFPSTASLSGSVFLDAWAAEYIRARVPEKRRNGVTRFDIMMLDADTPELLNAGALFPNVEVLGELDLGGASAIEPLLNIATARTLPLATLRTLHVEVHGGTDADSPPAATTGPGAEGGDPHPLLPHHIATLSHNLSQTSPHLSRIILSFQIQHKISDLSPHPLTLAPGERAALSIADAFFTSPLRGCEFVLDRVFYEDGFYCKGRERLRFGRNRMRLARREAERFAEEVRRVARARGVRVGWTME
ncbi:hypothetical protein M427DRAFT_145353 [Gonapodya prolifera JEL478]|uniref:F-box domain-containing protein n=1 Tax=Gonapodya prolifera (strain JEL478) TaxID=1344416 RepID=A0A139AGD5_GONPJ|nr:hypothetical protein M427DRAFT_145353 [Gonapodya prolifera JEL478]|eukprot:KXS15857.1 hypothetical protein M427DRAFT_145353 [Gonapodya prolifera JEL478]